VVVQANITASDGGGVFLFAGFALNLPRFSGLVPVLAAKEPPHGSRL
jgi:hypothetical protein